jgi:hypothetical protein
MWQHVLPEMKVGNVCFVDKYRDQSSRRVVDGPYWAQACCILSCLMVCSGHYMASRVALLSACAVVKQTCEGVTWCLLLEADNSSPQASHGGLGGLYCRNTLDWWSPMAWVIMPPPCCPYRCRYQLSYLDYALYVYYRVGEGLPGNRLRLLPAVMARNA